MRNNTKQAKLAAPFDVTADNTGRLLVKPAHGIRLAAYHERASHFLQSFFESEFFSDDAEIAAIACAIALESFESLGELRVFLQANQTKALVDSQWAISWIALDGAQDRRFINPVTLIALNRVSQTCCWDQALAKFDASLARTRPRRFAGPGELKNLSGLLMDMSVHHFLSLNRVLYCHIARVAPMTALADSAYARLCAKRPLRIVNKFNLETPRTQDAILADVIDNAFQSTQQNSGGWVISELKHIASAQRKQSRPKARQAWLENLHGLSSRLSDTSPAAAAMVGWALHMLTVGTPYEQDPSPNTIYAYIAAVAMELFQALNELNCSLPDLDIGTLEKIYSDIRVQRTNNRQVPAALHCFHDYLSYNFDLPALKMRLVTAMSTQVKANIVWPHEAEAIRMWIERSDADARFRQQLRLVFEIGYQLHLRIDEIFSVQIKNVRRYPEGPVELEVAANPRSSSGKTAAARRIIQVTCPLTQKLLVQWVNRRIDENALESEYLFGDPYDSDRLFQRGKTYAGLSRLLKTATGDSKISPHTLRHGVSIRISNVLNLTEHSADLNPFDIIAFETGHRSIQTTLQSYSHLFEQALREGIDRGLQSFSLTYHFVERLTGISNAALRKKVSRAKESRELTLKNMISNCALTDQLQLISCRFDFAELPDRVELIGKQKLSVAGIACVLHDIASGLSARAISLRSTHEPDTLHQIFRFTLDAVTSQFVSRAAWKKLIHEDPLAVLQNLHELDIQSYFQRAFQSKLLTLSRYLNQHALNETVGKALQSWQACVENEYFSLELPFLAEPLILLLHAAGIPLSRLLVRAVPGAHSTTRPAVGLHRNPIIPGFSADGYSLDLLNLFQRVYGGTPQFEPIEHRRGRPGTYLLLSSGTSDGANRVQNAAASIAGLHALMIAAQAFRKIVDRQNKQNEWEA